MTMTDGLPAKKGHSLFKASSAEDFIDRFTIETGMPPRTLIETFVDPDAVVTVVVAGSIALGIGTGASDVDLLVLTSSPDALRPDGADGKEQVGVLFSTAVSGDQAALATGQIVALVNGVEIDLQTLSIARLETMLDDLNAGRFSRSEQDTALLSRLKTGWSLDDTRCGVLERMRRDQALEIHWATRYFVFALQGIEDARAALDDNLPLALHLQRRSVEMAFLAYFASRGFAFLGAKWPRFMTHHCRREAGRDVELETWATTGLRLLFPTLDLDRQAIEASLERNAAWLNNTRRRIDQNMACRIAFKMSRQIGDLDDD